jgi:hypothetical protein
MLIKMINVKSYLISYNNNKLLYLAIFRFILYNNKIKNNRKSEIQNPKWKHNVVTGQLDSTVVVVN